MGIVAPGVGPVTGGTSVEIAGSDLLDTAADDDFSGAVIDPVRWIVATNGAGSSAVEGGGHLTLAAGPVAGSYARIDSTVTMLDTDIEVAFSVQTDVAALVALAPVELAALRLSIDANNYAQVARKAGGAFGDRYEVAVVVGGVAIESAYQPTSELSGSLRIIRRGSTVYLYAGTTELLRRDGFPTTAAQARVSVANLTAAYAVQTAFDNFFAHTMVVLGTEPMLDAQVISEGRVLGTTPPGARVGIVDVHVATYAVPAFVIQDAFTYEDAAHFTVLAPLSGAVSLTIANDTILRNLRTGRPGFTR